MNDDGGRFGAIGFKIPNSSGNLLLLHLFEMIQWNRELDFSLLLNLLETVQES